MEENIEKARNDETTAANKIENKFKPIISEIETKISIEKNNLENILKKISDLQPKKEKANTALKHLKKESEIAKNVKKYDLNLLVSEIQNNNLSIKKVSAIIEEITKSNLNPRIEELKTKLEDERKSLDTTFKKIDLLNEKKKEIANKLRDLNSNLEEIDHEKEIALKKRLKEFLENKFQMTKQPIENEINKIFNPKINDLKETIGFKKKELDEVIKLLEELINKKNELSQTIKDLEKKHKDLLSEKETQIKNRLNSIEDDMKERIDAKLRNERTIKYESIIKETKNKLNKEKMDLDSANQKIQEFSQRINEIGNIINNWMQEHKIIFKNFINDLKAKYKQIETEVKSKTGIKQDGSDDKEILYYKGRAKQELEKKINPKLASIDDKLNNERNKSNQIVQTLTIWKKKKEAAMIEVKILRGQLKETESLLKSELKKLIEETLSRQKAKIQNQTEKVFNPQIKKIEIELENIKSKYSEIMKNIESLESKKTKLNAAIKEFESEYKKFSKVKQNTMKIEIGEINMIKNEIKKLSFDEKLNIENEIKIEYKNKIAETELERNKLNGVLVQLNLEFAALTKNRIELSSKINLLMKVLKDLSDETFTEVRLNLSNLEHGDNELALKRVEKEINEKYGDKINDLNSQLKNETSEFLTLTDNYVDLLSKKKAIEKNIKLLEKQNEEVNQQKKLFLKSELKKVCNNRDVNIKLIKKEINILNKDLKILIKAIARGI